MINNATGIILAGGKSTRMGTNKAFLRIGGHTIIEGIFARLKAIFSRVVIIANEIELFDSLPAEVIPDIIPSKGPLGGIYTGLVKSESFYNFVSACDMPFLCKDVIGYMLEQSSGHDIVVPEYKGRLEPLCAVYSKACIEPVDIYLRGNDLKIAGFFKHVRVRIVSEEEIASLDPQRLSFVNINATEDYNKFKG